jgi:hypothetical protein
VGQVDAGTDGRQLVTKAARMGAGTVVSHTAMPDVEAWQRSPRPLTGDSQDPLGSPSNGWRAGLIGPRNGRWRQL